MTQIELLTPRALHGKTSQQKLNFILQTMRKTDKILVLEEPLTPQEEAKLIELTMESIDNTSNKRFTGIEVATLGASDVTDIKTRLVKLLGGRPSGLTVIGPSKIVKQIKKDPHKLNLLTGR